jgi:hypothetical protein
VERERAGDKQDILPASWPSLTSPIKMQPDLMCLTINFDDHKVEIKTRASGLPSYR